MVDDYWSVMSRLEELYLALELAADEETKRSIRLQIEFIRLESEYV